MWWNRLKWPTKRHSPFSWELGRWATHLLKDLKEGSPLRDPSWLFFFAIFCYEVWCNSKWWERSWIRFFAIWSINLVFENGESTNNNQFVETMFSKCFWKSLTNTFFEKQRWCTWAFIGEWTVCFSKNPKKKKAFMIIFYDLTTLHLSDGCRISRLEYTRLRNLLWNSSILVCFSCFIRISFEFKSQIRYQWQITCSFFIKCQKNKTKN